MWSLRDGNTDRAGLRSVQLSDVSLLTLLRARRPNTHENHYRLSELLRAYPEAFG